MTLTIRMRHGYTVTITGGQLDDMGYVADLLAMIGEDYHIDAAIIDWGWGEQVIFDENGLYVI